MFLRLNDSWPSAAPYGTVLCHHWPPGRLSFLLKPFAFFPRRQKTWWHQDERQAKKRRNGGENCREIKRIDKVGASQKKMGEEIDCDRREREGGRKSDAIDTLKLQREDRKMLFAPSKCYRKTYITMTALWPHQPHKKHTGLFHLPQIVINKNQDKDKHTHTHSQKGEIDEKEQWRVKKECRKRNITLWGGLLAWQREVESNGSHTSICQCDEISYWTQSHTPHCLLTWHLKHLLFLSLLSSPFQVFIYALISCLTSLTESLHLSLSESRCYQYLTHSESGSI